VRSLQPVNTTQDIRAAKRDQSALETTVDDAQTMVWRDGYLRIPCERLAAEGGGHPTKKRRKSGFMGVVRYK
jgi:hypothetical protein